MSKSTNQQEIPMKDTNLPAIGPKTPIEVKKLDHRERIVEDFLFKQQRPFIGDAMSNESMSNNNTLGVVVHTGAHPSLSTELVNEVFRKHPCCPCCGFEDPTGDIFDGGIGDICPECKWEVDPFGWANGSLSLAEWTEAVHDNGLLLPLNEQRAAIKRAERMKAKGIGGPDLDDHQPKLKCRKAWGKNLKGGKK